MHTTGGYLTQVAFTHKYVFDLHAEDDVYWCAADIGWVTGHSYIVYGPLANGATSVMYEGTPDFPDKDRWWAIIERYGVTILYCAPTAIRTMMKWGTAVSGGARPRRRCACSAASASRSTPRRGSGTTTTSAAAGARSSTRGGRPRPGAIMISPAARRDRPSSPARPRSPCPASAPRSSTTRAHRSPRAAGTSP